jgi:ABC-type transport system involved in cytochrome c biogenesis permease subunit
MAACLGAFVLFLVRRRRCAWGFYAAAFAALLAAVTIRWADVRHAPLQSMFEVFVFLGALLFPLSVFGLRVLRVGGVAADPLLTAAILFPAAFVAKFSAQPDPMLPPALQTPLFPPHVGAYLAAYVIFAKAALLVPAALVQNKDAHPFSAMDRLVRLGFPLLTAGLILGAIWAKLANGDWWAWDPKEMWSLATWLIYVLYFHVRAMFGSRFPRLGAALVVLGFLFCVLTLLWVNLNLGRFFSSYHNYAG